MAIWNLNQNVHLRVERGLGRALSIAEPRFLHYRRIFTRAEFSRSEPKSWMTRQPEVGSAKPVPERVDSATLYYAFAGHGYYVAKVRKAV